MYMPQEKAQLQFQNQDTVPVLRSPLEKAAVKASIL